MAKKEVLTPDALIVSVLDFQFWVWGQDIQNKNGNILKMMGFERTRANNKRLTSSSAYELTEENTYVCLWGFGMFYGVEGLGGIFISRHSLVPFFSSVWKQPKPFWALKAQNSRMKIGSQLSPLSKKKADTLFLGALHWIAEYEKRLKLLKYSRLYKRPKGAIPEPIGILRLENFWRDLSKVFEGFESDKPNTSKKRKVIQANAKSQLETNA